MEKKDIVFLAATIAWTEKEVLIKSTPDYGTAGIMTPERALFHKWYDFFSGLYEEVNAHRL